MSIQSISSTRQSGRNFGTSLSFPGTTGLVDLGTGNVFSGSFYYACWIKWFGLNGGFQTLIAKRDTYASNGLMFSMSLVNTTGLLAVDTVTSFVPFGYQFPINKWTHMVWVHDVTSASDLLYINGSLNSTQGIGTLGTKTTAALSIGSTQGGDWFNGEIDESVISVITTTPTTNEIYQMYAKSVYTGTIYRYFKFDEGSGSTAIDLSSNATNATITGATYVNDPYIPSRTASGDNVYNNPITNLIVNPSIETNTTGWLADPTAGTRITSGGKFGPCFTRVTSTTNAFDRIKNVPVWSNTYRGQIAVFSAYMKSDVGSVNASMQLSITGQTTGNGLLLITDVTSSWKRYSVSIVIDQTATAWTAAYLYAKTRNTAGTGTIDFDGIQLEILNPNSLYYPTNYCDGTQTNCTWTGTAHASTSTRNTSYGRATGTRTSV